MICPKCGEGFLRWMDGGEQVQGDDKEVLACGACGAFFFPEELEGEDDDVVAGGDPAFMAGTHHAYMQQLEKALAEAEQGRVGL